MAHIADLYLLTLQKSLHTLALSSPFKRKKKGGNGIDGIFIEAINENFPKRMTW